jgi:hypothetical protein
MGHVEVASGKPRYPLQCGARERALDLDNLGPVDGFCQRVKGLDAVLGLLAEQLRERLAELCRALG